MRVQRSARRLAVAGLGLGACAFDSDGLGSGSATIDDPSTSAASETSGSDPGDGDGDTTNGSTPDDDDDTTMGSGVDGTSSDTGPPSSWWDKAWAKRRRIHLSLPEGVAGPLAGVPVLVQLEASRIPYGELLPGGHDLRFVDDDDATVLAHEIERWAPDGISIVWVTVPMLGERPDDSVLMYWGNADAEDGQDAAAVWGDDHAAVWHLDDRVDVPPPQVLDSSPSGLDGAIQGMMDQRDVVDGWTGRALSFDGVDDSILIGPVATDDWTALTMSAWLRHGGTGDERALSKADGTMAMDHVFFLGAHDEDVKVRVQTDGDGGGSVELRPDGSLPPETWSHVVATWSAEEREVVVYVDGEEVESTDLGGSTLVDQSSDTLLANAFAGEDRHWLGILDEVRLERVARGPDWVLTQYVSMTDALAEYGAEQAAP